jgi:phage terminase small subunit
MTVAKFPGRKGPQPGAHRAAPPALPPRPIPHLPAPPEHLAEPERALWTAWVRAYSFSETASLSLLDATLCAHMRHRTAREQVAREGATLVDRFGHMKPHPLLTVERDARAQFMQGMKLLRLDLEGS